MAKQPPVTCQEVPYRQSLKTTDSVISDSDYEITAAACQLWLGTPSLTCKRQNAQYAKKVLTYAQKKTNDIRYL